MQNHPNFDILKTSLFTTSAIRTPTLAPQSQMRNISKFQAPKMMVPQPRVAPKIPASVARMGIKM